MLHTQKLDVRRSRRLGDQVNLTFQFIRENARGLVKSLVYIVGPSALLTGGILAFLLLKSRSSSSSSFLLSGAVKPLLINVILVIALVMVQVVAISAVRLYLRSDEPVTHQSMLASVREIIGRLFSTSLAVSGIFVAIFAVQFLVATAQSAFLIILTEIGIFVTLLYLSVPMSLVPAIRIFEPTTSIGEAITRSFEITKGHWWYSLGLILMLSIVSGYMAFSPVYPVRFILELTKVFRSGSFGSSTLDTVFVVVWMVLGYFTSFLWILGITLNYFNLVEKLDGVGLLERIGSIGMPKDDSAQRHSLT